MDKKGTNILEGEASESDEELSDYPGFVQNTMVTASKTSDGPSSSVVVTGEASESDEDIGDYILRRDFPSLQSQGGTDFEMQEDCSVTIEARKPKYESPFHKKLWERNFSFRLGIVQHKLERYEQLKNRLQSFIPHANRSQNCAQEALKHYRIISEKTKELNDNLENILRNVDLPELNDSVSLE